MLTVFSLLSLWPAKEVLLLLVWFLISVLFNLPFWRICWPCATMSRTFLRWSITAILVIIPILFERDLLTSVTILILFLLFILRIERLGVITLFVALLIVLVAGSIKITRHLLLLSTLLWLAKTCVVLFGPSLALLRTLWLHGMLGLHLHRATWSRFLLRWRRLISRWLTILVCVYYSITLRHIFVDAIIWFNFSSFGS